ncbi:MAG: GNAT family N-acetyltransferase [Anaerolineales bacterium]
MNPSDLFIGVRIRLTALTKADIPTITSWYQNSALMRLFASVPARPKSEEQIAQWLSETEKETGTLTFAIRPLYSDELMGYLQLDGINYRNGHCGIALILAPDYQDKGYGTEATQLGLRYAFNELALHKVIITNFSYNARAIALAEKLGFQRDGVFRDHLLRGGQRHDMYLYSLLRHEWEAIQK